MDPHQTKKRPWITTEAYDKNAKRREVYNNMTMAEKNALLLQRRLKKRETTTNRLLASKTYVNPVEPASVMPATNECEVCTPPAVLHKEKNVLYPFHVFEKGSTSGTSNESSATSFESILVDELLMLLLHPVPPKELLNGLSTAQGTDYFIFGYLYTLAPINRFYVSPTTANS
ncbi:PREDICTED: uncharacterized protein LOC109215183 isoform X2 [Nicotiana attenuata]|uniref:uncharacterized protein LOC109215183 isoform X2 n=1 Tax=Nicotiana attenuata TaxID=49451 RepID=UPI000905685A|nr:PREDICTED: uncharacterized protein LOC109215183 isoform X2 [Nicotiana attenuata]